MTRYPRQVDREYLPRCSGGLHKIQMIDGGTLDLHQDLVACDRRRRYIVEYQLPTVFQNSNSFHASSPYVCLVGATRSVWPANDPHYPVAAAKLRQFRNDGSAPMAASAAHTYFHVNLQSFFKEQRVLSLRRSSPSFQLGALRTPVRFQPLGEESTDGIQRLCCRLQSSDASGKPMWHPHPHISPGIDACGNCTLNMSERVVEQHCVATDVNAGGRHAGVSTVEGRSQRMFRVGATQVGMHELRYLRASKKGIGIRARLVGRARKSQVGDRRQDGNSDKSRVDGGGFAGDARREYQCQVASSGVSRKSDPVNVPIRKSSVTRQHIVRGRRKRVFGSKPIVRDERPRSRPCGNMPDEMAVGLGGSKVEPATVQVDDHPA